VNQSVSIPHWYDYNVEIPQKVERTIAVSIPHWYDYNDEEQRKPENKIDVSIPHWYDYNYTPLLCLDSR
jgi:hypothetical protein